MIDLQLISRTHFTRSNQIADRWEWFWEKETPSGRVICVSEVGYDSLGEAFESFYSREPIDGLWKYGMLPPINYAVQKFAEDHWVITRHLPVTQKNIDN
ncbi:hypothetical protein CL65_gp085 [Mycobacterium phage Patience]|uniref:Uncharacterized protein n=1 Tax=Mycobacterium phage Patience TaxID=1074308 RepID=G1JWJ5_9CAUD|nr:hypothetical protein CL65_gp085 [Mycobacterium phage Patience]AEL97993.1 hypothetical protein PATIENCE_84 [Mycobacterium phage Patience]